MDDTEAERAERRRESRGRTIDVRLSDEELDALREASAREGLALATWARRAMLAAARARPRRAGA